MLSQEEMEALSTAFLSGMTAIFYITDPDRWPGFAAFAEQMTPEHGEWTEKDRLCMRQDAKLLMMLAERYGNK